MPETTEVMFDWPEVLRLLVRAAGIEEGCWALNVRLNLVGTHTGSEEVGFRSAAVVTMIELGLQRVETLVAPLSVDAATLVTEH